MNNKLKNNKGQAMLLAVLLIGTSILTISSIAGYLTLQRIRMSSQFVDSTKAIFAADAGLECEFYNYFVASSTPVDCDGLSFEDGKTAVNTTVSYDASSTPQYIKSIGSSNKANRAFMASFK